MKLRKFITYLSLFTMLLFAGFGSFYIITGENILTGQKRGQTGFVLNASDSREEELKDLGKVKPTVEEVKNDEISEEVQAAKNLFTEVVSKTEDQFDLETLDGSEAVVTFGAGSDKTKNYIAVWGSGLDISFTYYVWFTDENLENTFKVGNLKDIAISDNLGVALITDKNLQGFTSVVVTAEEPDFTPTELNSNKVSFKGDINSEELFITTNDTKEEKTEQDTNENINDSANESNTDTEETKNPAAEDTTSNGVEGE